MRDGRVITEPDDYHSLDRRNVGTFCIVTDDGKDVVRINCKRNRTFFHRLRGLKYSKATSRPGGGFTRSEEFRIVGYWAPDHWLCLFVWDENRVEQIEDFYGEHAIYGRLTLYESEIADAHRSGAVIVNGTSDSPEEQH